MDIGEMLGNSFEYTKEGLMGKWMKWVLLIVCAIIFPLIYGYGIKIMKGITPAPEIDDWVGMLIDGIKLIIIEFVWSIPIMIIAFIVMGGSILAIASGSDAGMAAGALGFLGGMLLIVILSIIISLFAIIGAFRFARTDSIGEAFNVSAIMDTIQKIGWAPYIIDIIVLVIAMAVIGFILGILMAIPVLGWILYLFALPAVTIFAVRYLTLVYDTAGT
ncbi:MAG: DUF4013 domain-containing protein [Methanomicrobiales archaeon]|nr:DUF4013 domain-containing protein [Methanomicrobiales archaeon]